MYIILLADINISKGIDISIQGKGRQKKYFDLIFLTMKIGLIKIHHPSNL